ncbi:PfpI family intracellular protease (macronuclear) [Tetrahymena thermophila SB210]|uniref:PfpI family intracellular protease n=1 Tax=Tetrahymena thermophila (strain SB210) TaxID=312017 RepID=Q24FT7_TETTS|nr:PfpI family intracellular protease [Tetrahymena thermophila SB210]EAS06673.1 PfpI family intracellular protease [Tetrahymena thermophila SB210]|eukprot:XP_001026918.1 PfpI family intracellular protease [Tetrahymena thermophila SB210]
MSQKILLITGDFGEDYEVMVPFQVLHAIGYTVHTVCPNKKAGDYVTCVVEEGGEIEKFQTYTEKIGHRFFLNYDFDQVKPEEYYALVLAGGRAPEYLKYDPSVLKLVKHFTDSKKSILVICHGYQILCALQGCIEGIVLGGPTPTSYEITNAGGIYQQIKMEDALLYNNFISTPAYTGFLKCFPPFIEQLKNGVKFDNKVHIFK